ncbi:hypothetical protein EPN96_06515 [bacterium]|nr:MAG: hypothetical protein EPN96_06515 [bacterium]
MKRSERSSLKSMLFAAVTLAVMTLAAVSFAEEKAIGGGTESGATGTKPPVETQAAQAIGLPKGVSHLKFKGGLLEVKAEGAELTEVLKAISKETGVELDFPEDMQGKVTVNVKGSWLQDGLTKILNAAGVNSYAFNFNDSKETRLYKITILKDGIPGAEKSADKSAAITQKPANYPEPGLKRRWSDEEAEAYFQTKYGPWLKAKGGDQAGFVFSVARGKLPDWIKIETQADALSFAQSFIADNPEAFQLGESELRPNMRHWGGNYPNIDFEQYYKGIPVEGGFVNFSFGLKEHTLHVLNDLGPVIDISIEPKITAEEAVEIVKKDLKSKGIECEEGEYERKNKPKLFISTTSSREGISYELQWEVVCSTYVYSINANNGSARGHNNAVE